MGCKTSTEKKEPERGQSIASRRSRMIIDCGCTTTKTGPTLRGTSARGRASYAITRTMHEKDLAARRQHKEQLSNGGGVSAKGFLSLSSSSTSLALSAQEKKEKEQHLGDEYSSVRRGSNKKRRSRKGEKEEQSVDGDDEGFLEYEFEWELDLVKKSSSSCLPCHQGKSTSTPDLGGSDVDFGLGADLTPLQKSGGGPSDLEREKSATDAEKYIDNCDGGDQGAIEGVKKRKSEICCQPTSCIQPKRASEGVKKKRDAANIEQLIESPKGGEVSPENSDSNNCILLLPPSMPLLQLLLPSKECEAEESVDGEVTGGTTTANSSSCSIVDRNVNGSGTPLQQHPSVLSRGWGGSGSGSTVRSALKGGGGGLEWNNSSSFVDGGGGDVGPTPILSRRRSVGFHRPSSSAARTTTIAVATTTTSLSER